MRYAVLLLALAACGESKPAAVAEPVKAGRIEFEFSGQWRGTAVAYFDEFGEVVTLREDMAVHPKKDKARRLTIWKDGQSIICDLDSKRAYASSMRVGATVLSADLRGERKATETIAGRQCEVYESDEARVSMHGGICLKFVDKKAGWTKTATKFEQLDAVPTKHFELPEGYRLR